MKPCRVMSVQSLRMHALKALAPDRANLHKSIYVRSPPGQGQGWGRRAALATSRIVYVSISSANRCCAVGPLMLCPVLVLLMGNGSVCFRLEGALLPDQRVEQLVCRALIGLLQMLQTPAPNISLPEGAREGLHRHKLVGPGLVCPVLLLVLVRGDLLQEVSDALPRWQLKALRTLADKPFQASHGTYDHPESGCTSPA